MLLSLRLCSTLCKPHQALLFLGFSGQEYWSGLPFPSSMHSYMLSCFSHVRLCATLWTAAHQAPLSMGFPRQAYWSGLPFPSPGDFLTQGLNLGPPHCRQMLYPLSHQGRSFKIIGLARRFSGRRNCPQAGYIVI